MRAKEKRDQKLLHSFNFLITSETPLIAAGNVNGVRVTFEEYDYRAGATRGIAPNV